jgi:serine/threonine-protein kinase
MQLPARIGKYELEEFLGGGMSHVYRARDTVIGRTVAVKILTEAGCQDSEAKARFLAEARMAGGIAHDNVISIFDFGEDDQHRPFMVMEFLRGEDLRQAIKNDRTGDLKSKLRIALQVARALQYIHEQKIIHRDIKPENIHVTGNGVVKLMDFGIAKTEGLAMTRAGYVLGTPYYMAPEQVTGQNITEQVDVYAFGVLLFELLSGQKPIAGDTVERIFYSILNEPLNLQPLYDANVPQAVCDLVASCTAKTPAARPQGFAPVCDELEQLIVDYGAPTMAIRASRVGLPSLDLEIAKGDKARSEQPAEVASPLKKWLAPGIAAAVVVLAVGLYLALRPPAKPADGTGGTVATKTTLEPTLATPTGEMDLVPAGAFKYGKDDQSVTLPAFYIDKTEVTNGAFLQFHNAMGYPLPAGFPKDKPDYPVVNVTIIDAHAFSKWAEKRLPTAQEWEKAARGTDGRLFPWGNTPDTSRCNVDGPRLRPATDFPDGASPYGALNMVGNAWELVEQEMTPSPEAIEHYRILIDPPPKSTEPWYQMRGMSFGMSLASEAVRDYGTVPARFAGPSIGFRCAKDAK